jgi:hypothetical protein
MHRRPLLLAASLLVLAACTRPVPPEPAIGFAQATALPPSAGLAELVGAGGRVLSGDAVRTVVAMMGEDAFLQAIGGGASDALRLRPDGAACINDVEPTNCRRIVADGMNYRVFALAGEPLGMLNPSPG